MDVVGDKNTLALFCAVAAHAKRCLVPLLSVFACRILHKGTGCQTRQNGGQWGTGTGRPLVSLPKSP